MDLKAYKLERRIDAVIRWLERMKAEYRRGAVESAYLDAECARADLEYLRVNMFSGMRPISAGKSSIIPQVIFLSMIIVMTTVVPISREKVPVYPKEPVILAEPVAMAEAVDPAPIPTKPKPSKSRKVQPVKRVTQSQTPTPPIVKPTPKPEKTPAYDSVYMLLQTGQRALRNDKSVIKVK